MHPLPRLCSPPDPCPNLPPSSAAQLSPGSLTPEDALGPGQGPCLRGVQFPTPSSSSWSFRNLAIGIGIQNFPEGLAVSLPLRGAGFSTWRAFW